MTKAEAERKWREELLRIGVEEAGCMYDRGNFYWFFEMKDGNTRFWKSPSYETLVMLGVDPAYAKENSLQESI